MRILYLIPSLDGSGGAEQAVAALAGPLTARGVGLEVVTLAPTPGPGTHGDLTARVESAGATVATLAPSRLPGPLGRAELAVRVAALVRDRRPDLVHTTLFDADLVGRTGGWAARVGVVSSLVNVAYGPEQRANPAITPWKLDLVRRADRATARVVRRFHALSPHVAEVMGPRLGIGPERIDVIPRGRDAAALGPSDQARRARVRAELGIAPDQVLVLAAARHEFQKGLDVLVAAWPTIRAGRPDAQLLIGGRRGAQTPQLQRLTAAQGPDAGIAWLGRRDDVADLLMACDAFVMPSRWEGFGSILVEAMALGANVVASDVGPIPEVAGSGWARLVPPQDPGALGAAVIEALDQDPSERRRRAEAGHRRFASTYDLEVVADATVAFYRRALG